MAKLTRVTGKVFAGNSPLDEIGQFGSALAGNFTNTTDVATIQGLVVDNTSIYEKGWGSAVVSSNNFPPMEEVNGVLKTISYQTCYLLQEGVPEYDNGTNYSEGSIVKKTNGAQLTLYISQEDENIGNALNDTTKWKPAVFTATSPIGVPQFTLNFNATLPTGCTWLEGATDGIPDNAYGYDCDFPNLYDIYGITYNDENTPAGKYKLPDFRNRVIWGAWNVDGAGYIEAGLPNATGYVTAPVNSTSGAGSPIFGSNKSGDYFDRVREGGWSQAGRINIDLSRSSSIYGNSNTVQPPAIKVRVYTRYE